MKKTVFVFLAFLLPLSGCGRTEAPVETALEPKPELATPPEPVEKAIRG